VIKCNINFVTHPTEIGCLYALVTKNGVSFHLTVGDTYAKLYSTEFKAEFDARNLSDAINKSLNLITFITRNYKET